jgi:hypothetical protein
VRHEEQHRLDFIRMWGDGGGGANSPYNKDLDKDKDGMNDSMEETFIEGRKYKNFVDLTYKDEWNYGEGYDDAEDACMWQQIWPAENAYDKVDWAKPGCQWGEGFFVPGK